MCHSFSQETLLPICPSRWPQCTYCRLIALDKNPGLCPTGVGEISPRIITRAVLSVIGGDIQEAAGSIQLCSGQTSGIEAAVHAIKQAYQYDAVEAVLLVDAFNCLNREAALRNIRYLCLLRLIHIGNHLISIWMGILCSPRKELLRGTQWPWPCMLSAASLSFGK